MLLFQRNRECLECPHHKAAHRNPCIPSRLLSAGEGARRCLLIVGEKPGVDEDQKDQHFTGNIGLYVLDAYVPFIQGGVKGPLDIYGTNAVRCLPEEGDSVTEAQAKKCSGLYLVPDVKLLREAYDEVYVLACGGPASKAVSGRSLGGSFRRQSDTVMIGDVECRAFYTFNPGVLLPGRDPGLSRCIYEHLLLLIDYLNHGTIPTDLAVPQFYGPVSKPPASCDHNILSIDIETYGAVEGYKLTNKDRFGNPCQHYHPQRSMALDECPREELIQTVAVGWDIDGKHYVHLFVLPDHIHQLRQFFSDAVARGFHLLGMNFAFDMTYLRTDPIMRLVLDRRRFRRSGSLLLDLAVSNFLECDNRPEKSLKEIAPLLRVFRYDEEQSLKGGFRYENRYDPELHYYNVCDVSTTLESHLRLSRRALRRYPTEPKFSDTCLRYYSDCLWSVIEMDESGVQFGRELVRGVHHRTESRILRIASRAEWRYGLKVAGTGSEKPLKELVARAAIAAGVQDTEYYKKYGRTKKKGNSLKQEVLYYIVDRLPLGDPLRNPLRLRIGYKKAQKIISSYTSTLLEDPAKGLLGGMAWPTWYTVPSRVKDEDGALGGTKQGRMTCHGPGLQTDPPVIQACRTSRFTPGVLLHADLSQVELRVAAICSGDPVMMQEFRDNLDNHSSTGLVILRALLDVMVMERTTLLYGMDKRHVEAVLEEADRTTITKENVKHFPTLLPSWPRIRQIGKTSNFLMIFRGGAETWQATVRRDTRMELSMAVAQGVVRGTMKKYRGLVEWQDALVEDACRRKYVALPVTGDTRTFAGSAKTIRRSYLTNIVNFPVQTGAAWILKSAQRCVSDNFQDCGMKALVTENIYDAINVDAPACEEAGVRRIVDARLAEPPFYRELVNHYGNDVPLGHEISVMART